MDIGELKILARSFSKLEGPNRRATLVASARDLADFISPERAEILIHDPELTEFMEAIWLYSTIRREGYKKRR